ncbi:MFS family permease [Texcoconibacillus texcoconensis]|uniref:MFS family permease n=2 Tax=Texcoconibacillus texcoconensis TaxID=1095777 RepID=A0A840QSK7_9BACI|nr:MFS family permease [Texcoconibacillus texcoconensis]
MAFLVYIVIIIAFLDTFIQLPIIAPYAESVGASSFLIGLIIGVYSFANMIGNALSGHWIDRFGRKKMMVIGMLTAGAMLLFYPFANSGLLLFFIRLLHGIAGGILIPASFAYLSDISTSGKRGKTMAFSGASIGTAAIIGPALAGIISSYYRTEVVFLLVAILFFLVAIFVVPRFHESYTVRENRTFKMSEIKTLITKNTILTASSSAFSLMATMGALTFALPLKLENLGHSSAMTGIVISTFGIVAIFVFLSPLNRLFDTYTPKRVILIGQLAVAAALMMLAINETTVGLFLIMGVYGIGFALIFPSMNRLVVDASDKHERGKAFGLFYACFSLGVVVGSTFVGVISSIPDIQLLAAAIFMFTFFTIHYFFTRS